MKFFLKLFSTSIILMAITSCQTVTSKVDNVTQEEEQKLSNWIGKNEKDLKAAFGNPDRLEFNDTRNRFYVYESKKFQIKCERKFEINQNNMVLGFSSKNCF